MTMRVALTLLAGCTALALAAPATASARPAPARDTLPARDGWASADGGTTGGAGAGAARTHSVTTWEEFTAALSAGGDGPRVIEVEGVLDATGPGGCAAFEAEGYDFAEYLAAYDPAVWGRDRPVSGEQEELRAASAARQAAAVTAYIPSNTTVVGVGRHAGIVGGSLRIKGADNVVVRNLTLESPLDCFPQWDPTDGERGAWNSEYDSAVVHGSTHVWLDHNTFTDGDHPDSSLPSYYGELYQRHDGELDIVRGADLVTVSWNVFADHDKTLMIGNSDGAGDTDRDKLRVTLHHNLFRDVVERAPRVRFGKVDAYNNHYVVPREGYQYSFGVGAESRLVAEANAVTLPTGVGAGRVLKKWKDAPVTAGHNHVNGRRVDLVAAHNAEFPQDALRSGAGWRPHLRTHVDHPRAVPRLVGHRAGAGRLR
ncbi:pectate lyase [Streptomyces alfalfae]|uniref:Pectate lyase n=1 Tax=Streptomyces alfalfae TaxID=1642299 RepID=A0ABM6GNN1_9ACTN|nr:polysaccharide lyase family 1 protein [Streptomyces alfalfae]AYA15751.1 pectate lyase [Streptomyces fradiae]APY85400.1 pectate lyase [Streptomyces alfalfae]QUI34789.1 polysaccharide lyase family 1 protein [Streptomyces alfalfae]RXX39228.1 pectate lyase [Streptomyces alfalfae]RZM98087.1 pectate lyase [Streptomyces alfalfae]